MSPRVKHLLLAGCAMLVPLLLPDCWRTLSRELERAPTASADFAGPRAALEAAPRQRGL